CRIVRDEDAGGQDLADVDRALKVRNHRPADARECRCDCQQRESRHRAGDRHALAPHACVTAFHGPTGSVSLAEQVPVAASKLRELLPTMVVQLIPVFTELGGGLTFAVLVMLPLVTVTPAVIV